MNRLIKLTSRQRRMLHNLLHGNLRKCSSAALESSVRQGWTSGMWSGYQLTEKGRRLAELSEQGPAEDRPMEISAHELEAELLEAAAPQFGQRWGVR
jgi:hypothetical protein